MTAIRNILTHHRSLPRLPWLVLLDVLGLFAAILLVVVQIGPMIQQVEGRIFALLLLAFGINAYLLVSQFKSIETLLGKYRAIMLAAPLIAALSTLTIQALSRAYYSGTALLLYVVLWTVWMFVIRILSRNVRPPLRLLLIGNPAFRIELEHIPNLQLTSLHHPPNQFQNWDIVVIDPSETYSKEWLQWLAHSDLSGVRSLSAPLVIETLTRRIPLNMLQGIWAYEILSGHHGYNQWKRLFDLVAVIVLAPFILLLCALVALALYRVNGAPVLFWQERIGKDGKTFQMVKFRTMRADAEDKGAAFAQQDDPRITRLGRFLRKFRLDEIPQFWNVLKGEMSIIGPRPEQKQFVERFKDEIPLYELRHNVRPGITGWAQVMQGYAASTDATRDKLCYDFYYVKHCSPGLDVRVVYQTVMTVLTGFGSR